MAPALLFYYTAVLTLVSLGALTELHLAQETCLEEAGSMWTVILKFVRDDEGQDLIEYTLLMAFIALASAALFVTAGGSLTSIWTSGSSTLSTAAVSAS